MAIASELLAELAGGGRQADAAIGAALKNFLPSIQAAQANRLEQKKAQLDIDAQKRATAKQEQISNILSTSFDDGQFSYKNAANNLRRAGFGAEGDKVEDQGLAVNKAEDDRRKAFSELDTKSLDRGIKITAAVGSAFGSVVLAPDEQVDEVFNSAVQSSKEFLSPEQLDLVAQADTPTKKRKLSQSLLQFGAKTGENLSFLAREKELTQSKNVHAANMARETKETEGDIRAQTLRKFINARAQGIDPATVLNDAEQLILGETLGPGMDAQVGYQIAENMPDFIVEQMKNNPGKATKIYEDTIKFVSGVLTSTHAKKLKFGTGKVTDTHLRAMGFTRITLQQLMDASGITDESVALRFLLEKQRRARTRSTK